MVDIGRFDNGRHQQSFAIYYEDTDAGGVVYHANYLKFAERARTNAIKLMGIHQSELKAKDGLFFVVSSCDISFKRPAILDDVVTVETALINMQKARMTMQQNIIRDERVICAVTVEIVMVNKNMKPTAIPEKIQQAITQHLTVSGES